MEYNYTEEFTQPIKLYSIPILNTPIPFAPNGLRLEHLIVLSVFLALLGMIAIIGFVAKISFLKSLFTNFWMLVIAGAGVLVWSLFSLTWDNKNFLDFLIGRTRFYRNKKKRYEHEMLVPLYRKKLVYNIVTFS
ncbi:TPA: TcpE family conjugal transfer membrane protein [Enterococcus faecium]